MFNKKLDKLTVNVELAGIPPAGFMRYYYNYDRDVKTSDFKVSLSYLKKRNWVPEGDNKQVFNLFDYVINYERSDEEVKTRQSFDIDLKEFKIDGTTKFSFEDQDFLFTQTTNGFLKFQLISPYIAFGHSLYQDVFIKNALKKKKKEDLFENSINPPYTPEITTISVDYSSSQVVDVKQLHDNNEIKIIAKIKVKDKDLAEKYKNKLNFMLRKFISPWFFDNKCEIKFNMNIRVADLYNFIKAQPEVACLWSLMVIKKHKNTLSIIRGYDNTVVPTTENCIFYSAAQHKIIIDDNDKNDEDNLIGIGNSSICEKFIIGTFKNEESHKNKRKQYHL